MPPALAPIRAMQREVEDRLSERILHGELNAYVKAGMTPFQALQAATVNSARALNLDAGAIAPKLRTSYENLALLVRMKHLVVPSCISVVAWWLECVALWVILGGFGGEADIRLDCQFVMNTPVREVTSVKTPHVERYVELVRNNRQGK